MDIQEIENKITNGEVVKIPTDTVYGYICDANNKIAIEKIYELKKRDKEKPLGIFVNNINKFYDVIDGGRENLDDNIKNILEKNWPGALTCICKKKIDILNNLNDGLDTIGIRFPNDKNLLKIMDDLDIILAQTSANISGEKDISSNKINGESTKASTIIDITSNKIKIIRKGDVIIDEE